MKRTQRTNYAELGGRARDRGTIGIEGVPKLPGETEVRRLDNGLTVCLLTNPQVPVVTTALWYRVGARHEAPGHGGTAHFLEHMMFKGSPAYGPGEVDRRTQLLGGSNNAFTTHDSTAYYFKLAPDRWPEALKMEADRMAELSLDPSEVSSERQVILEEISMYRNDPWDALEIEVQAAVFPDHPYGRSVLGVREELLTIDESVLRSFHDRHYCPQNAVLVIAGGLGEGAYEQAEEIFGHLDPREPTPTPPRSQRPPTSLQRVTRRKGEVARLLLSLPAPACSDLEHPGLRLLLTVLGGGKASRLHRSLVEEQQLCSWLSLHLTDSLDPGTIMVALETIPGVDPRRAESALLQQLDEVSETPPEAEEVERAKRILVADWVFGHERVHEQALALGFALTHYDLEYPERYLEHSLATDEDDLVRLASRYLRPAQGAVLGWSYPESTS